ncbi:endogenous retrovirus group K member 25 Pol protein-like protein [Turdus rufiventris]|nr:endogenous retrovirus group K member 25 Pol protein-like protein [Turdus rufiventris]
MGERLYSELDCSPTQLFKANCNEELSVLAKALQPPLTIPENMRIAKAMALPPHPLGHQVMTVIDPDHPSCNDHIEVHATWDCFFSIPLHPDDARRMAFSVPSLNREEPLERYHWVVLPKGLKNLPTICQWYVARALALVRKKYPEARIIHYMDDLLIAASTKQELQQVRDFVIEEVQKVGLEISTSKIQEIAPWKYLGWKITERKMKPQKIEISSRLNNLQDLQQLLGEINWMRPILGITNEDLLSLFNLLRGDSNIKSPRTLTPEAQKALERVAELIQQRQAHHYVDSLPFRLVILGAIWLDFPMGRASKRPSSNHRLDFLILQVSKDNSYKSRNDSSNHNKGKN